MAGLEPPADFPLLTKCVSQHFIANFHQRANVARPKPTQLICESLAGLFGLSWSATSQSSHLNAATCFCKPAAERLFRCSLSIKFTEDKKRADCLRSFPSEQLWVLRFCWNEPLAGDGLCVQVGPAAAAVVLLVTASVSLAAAFCLTLCGRTEFILSLSFNLSIISQPS